MNLKKKMAIGTILLYGVNIALNSIVYASYNNYSKELLDAIKFMNEKRVSSVATSPERYRPYDNLTREQASKLFIKFAEKTDKLRFNNKNNCYFEDIDQAGLVFRKYIKLACKASLIKGYKGKFMPKSYLTKLQFLTILERMIKEDGSIEPDEAYTMAFNKGLTKSSYKDTIRPMTRGELAIIFVRTYLKIKGTEEKENENNNNNNNVDNTEDIDLGDLGLDGLFGDDDSKENESSGTELTDKTDEAGKKEDNTDNKDNKKTDKGDKDTTEEKDNNNNDESNEENNDESNEENKVVETSISDNKLEKEIQAPYIVSSLKIGEYDITANNDIELDELSLKTKGFIKKDDIEKVWLESDGKIVAWGRTLNSDGELTFNRIKLAVKKGETVPLSIYVSLKANSEVNGSLVITEIKLKDGTKLNKTDLETSKIKTLNYDNASVSLVAKGSDTEVDINTESTLGEFEITEDNANSSKDILLKKIIFVNNGTLDLEDIEGLAIYDGEGNKISDDAIILDKDYALFKFKDGTKVENGATELYTIKGTIKDGDNGDTVKFEFEDKYYLEGVEDDNYSVGIKVNNENVSLATYTLNSGKFRITEYQNPDNQYAIPNQDNILILSAKTEDKQDVDIDKVRLYISDGTDIKDANNNGTANEIADINKAIDNVKMYVNDKLVDEQNNIVDGDNNGSVDVNDYYEFDYNNSFKDGDRITFKIDLTRDMEPDSKLYFKLDNTATSDGLSKSFTNIEYAKDGNNLDDDNIGGTVTSKGLEIRDPSKGVYITRNDGLNNSILLAGQTNAKMIGFIASAGNESSLKLSKFEFDVSTPGGVYSDITNCRLKDNSGKQYGTTEDLGSDNKLVIESINKTIEKGGNISLGLYCDINVGTNITSLQPRLNLKENSSTVMYDVNNDKVLVDNDNDGSKGENDGSDDVVGDNITIKDNADLYISYSSNTPNERLIYANEDNGIPVFSFKMKARYGSIKVKDLLFNINSDKLSTTRVKSLKVYYNSKQVAEKSVNTTDGSVYINMGDDGFTVNKDDEKEVLITALFNPITEDNQTYEKIKISFEDVVVSTKETGKNLTKAIINGKEIDIDNDGNNGNGLNFDGVNGNDLDTKLQGNNQYVSRSILGMQRYKLSDDTLSNGTNTLMKLVAVSAGKDSYIKAIAFRINAKLNGSTLDKYDNEHKALYTDDNGTAGYQSDDSQLNNFKLFVGGADKTDDGTFVVGKNKVVFVFNEGNELNISKLTKFIELKADALNVISDDYVVTNVEENTTQTRGKISIVNGYIDTDGNGVINNSDNSDGDYTILDGTYKISNGNILVNSNNYNDPDNSISDAKFTFGTYNIIDGRVDTDKDGTVYDQGDTSTSKVELAGYRIKNGQIDVNLDGTIDANDDGTVLIGGTSYNVIDGKIDVDNNGSVDYNDNKLNSNLLLGTYNIYYGQVDVDGDKLALNNTFSDDDLADKIYTKYNIIDGLVDIDGNGSVDSSDDKNGVVMNGGVYNIIDGQIDVDGNGSIDSSDDATDFEVAKGVKYDIIDGKIDIDDSGTVDGSDDATDVKFGMWDVIDGKIDINNDGSIDTNDDDDSFKILSSTYKIVDGEIDVNGNNEIDDKDDNGTVEIDGTTYKVIYGKIDINGDKNLVQDTDDNKNGTYKLINGKIDINNDGQITSADNYTNFEFPFGKKNLIKGMVDYNNDGVINNADTQAGLDFNFGTRKLIDGLIDYDNDGIIYDAGDDKNAIGIGTNTVLWSDNSASNHTLESNDWFNGYKVYGLSTDSQNLSN